MGFVKEAAFQQATGQRIFFLQFLCSI